MPNKQKNKGKGYERVVCKHLNNIFGLNFERVWGSGSFTGGVNESRLDRLTPEQVLLAEGDIIVPKELSHVKLECKFHKDLSFPKLFTSCAKLDEWIDQAQKSKRLLWLLIFKINYAGEYVVFDEKWKTQFVIPHNYLRYRQNYIIVTLEDFFEQNKDFILGLQ